MSTKDANTKRAKKKLLKSLKECSGIVQYACEKAKISRQTYYRWYNEDEEFRTAADDIQELQVDVAEAALLKKIQNGDTTAIIFYLKTKGKSRGYNERREISGPDGSAVPIASKVNIDDLTPELRKTLLKIAEKNNEPNGK